MSTEWMQLVVLVVSLVISGAIAYGVWLWRDYVIAKVGREEFESQKAEVERYLTVIRAIVESAEQKAKAGQLTKDARLAYVIDQVQAVLPGLTDQEVDFWVHAAVYTLNQSLRVFESSLAQIEISESDYAG